MRILIAEDDKELAEFTKDGLEREGFVVDWAPNGQEALALARESAYDVILLDVMMPEQISIITI